MKPEGVSCLRESVSRLSGLTCIRADRLVAVLNGMCHRNEPDSSLAPFGCKTTERRSRIPQDWHGGHVAYVCTDADPPAWKEYCLLRASRYGDLTVASVEQISEQGMLCTLIVCTSHARDRMALQWHTWRNVCTSSFSLLAIEIEGAQTVSEIVHRVVGVIATLNHLRVHSAGSLVSPDLVTSARVGEGGTSP